MANILAVGIATLDIINTVTSYPQEDDEIRTLSQHKTRGGNATNTLTILSQLGHNCNWAGVLIDESDSAFIRSDLAYNAINTDHCTVLAKGKMPTSYITVSQQTGSRTIVHHRDCPEYSYAAFSQIDLSSYDWVHFEGRNIDDTVRMLKSVKIQHPNLMCSVEIEKAREHIEQLISLADVVFFSHDYAKNKGYTHGQACLEALANNIIATCTWGKDGAWAKREDNTVIHSATADNLEVIDTLGAGDTFNAGMISHLSQKKSVEQALTFATQLASKKCSQHGLNDLIN
jgi:ketohexokinase